VEKREAGGQTDLVLVTVLGLFFDFWIPPFSFVVLCAFAGSFLFLSCRFGCFLFFFLFFFFFFFFTGKP